MRTCVFLLALLAIAPAQPAASALQVPGDYDTIADALTAATAGDTISVARNTYPEHGLQMKSGVTLESNTHTPGDVTIDGEGAGRILDCTGAATFYINGITFANGAADIGGALLLRSDAKGPARSGTIVDCAFTGNNATDSGGAIHIGSGVIAVVTECSFDDNSATNYGGAVRIDDDPSTTECYFGACTFTGNSAGEFGGAVSTLYGSTLNFTSCEFESNSSYWSGAADLRFAGGAVFAGCEFRRNTGSYGAGAMMILGSFCTIPGSFFTGNTAPNAGALYVVQSPNTTISRCTFVLNESMIASAVRIQTTEGLQITESIFAFAPGGEPFDCVDSDVTLLGCDVFGNADDNWVGPITGQDGSNGNLENDPLFCNMYTDDCRLCGNSPCLAVNNGVADIGAFGQGCADCGSPVNETTWGSIKTLYR